MLFTLAKKFSGYVDNVTQILSEIPLKLAHLESGVNIFPIRCGPLLPPPHNRPFLQLWPLMMILVHVIFDRLTRIQVEQKFLTRIKFCIQIQCHIELLILSTCLPRYP